MKIEAYTPEALPALVRFWNRAFAFKRNFFPVTEAVFRDRVVEKRTAVEAFDGRMLLLAKEGDEVVGMIHMVVRSADMCRALNPQWAGGAQGYVAFLYVDPPARGRGVGAGLWKRGLDAIRPVTSQVVVDGQCMNPFYGNSEGPFTPFWGTPEGVSIEWGDETTRKFLEHRGQAPRYRAVQLALDVAKTKRTPLEAIERDCAKDLFLLEYSNEECPEVGKHRGVSRPWGTRYIFECVSAVRGTKTAGLLSYYPLREARAGLFGIYELNVWERYRRHGLGQRLLAAAIERMRAQGADSCEVLTLPDVSPEAHKLYVGAGFVPAAEWAIY